MTTSLPTPRIAYDFALIRVVPHVATGAFCDIGVVMHARTAEFIDLAVRATDDDLTRLVPDVDIPLFCRYLTAFAAICRGDPAAGPVALLPPSERFHWLTAPRSDVLQCSPVHEGICDDPALELQELYHRHIRIGPPGSAANVVD
jgi:hypothetical protein